jgi:hypothetical protein
MRRIETAEDYRDYLADKTLHTAIINRVNVPTPDDLVRLTIEAMEREQAEPVTPPQPQERQP